MLQSGLLYGRWDKTCTFVRSKTRYFYFNLSSSILTWQWRRIRPFLKGFPYYSLQNNINLTPPGMFLKKILISIRILPSNSRGDFIQSSIRRQPHPPPYRRWNRFSGHGNNRIFLLFYHFNILLTPFYFSSSQKEKRRYIRGICGRNTSSPPHALITLGPRPKWKTTTTTARWRWLDDDIGYHVGTPRRKDSYILPSQVFLFSYIFYYYYSG